MFEPIRPPMSGPNMVPSANAFVVDEEGGEPGPSASAPDVTAAETPSVLPDEAAELAGLCLMTPQVPLRREPH